jgi:hypothetical protein
VTDDVCLAVALNCVLAAAIEHGDRQRLLEALQRGVAPADRPTPAPDAGAQPSRT